MATIQPSNNSELQLFRVLQRANLLQYFETFITQGGDDVQQLCEAGEDEFLEIMALVGMASKPLHVRRLQKALQEWVANPAAFEVPKKFPTHVMSISCSSTQSSSPSQAPMERSSSLQDFKLTPPQSSAISTSTPWSSQVRGPSPSEASNLDDASSSNSPQADFRDMVKEVLYNPNEPPYSGMLSVSQPVLLDYQISAIAAAAAVLAQELPHVEPKSMPKKQISADIVKVMAMSSDEPHRLEAMRKYAAIYGRFDSKRKNLRPMSMHEISVNEAAAQLCYHIPALLTRREELFPLARQIVRDSGYQYSKGHSSFARDKDTSFVSRAAEVVLPAKSELDDNVTASPPQLSPPGFHDMQRELTQISLDLTEVAKEQNRIRSALRVLLEMNDHDQIKVLTSEMDDLNDRQTAMMKRRKKLVNTIARYRKGEINCTVSADGTSKHSPKYLPTCNLSASKPMSSSGKHSFGTQAEDSLPGNPLNTLYLAAVQNQKDSLFEEGLRIAQQYGMSDFAQELLGMKSTKEQGEDTKESTVTPAILGSTALCTLNLDVVTSSSGKSLPLVTSLPSADESDLAALHQSRTSAHLSSQLKTGPGVFTAHGGKLLAATSPSSSEVTCLSNDESTDGSHVEEQVSARSSLCQSLSTRGGTTTTTITTKTGQVIEVETRRSNRKKNGDPDYYLINGGEKRFRSGNIRRNSSTSSEQGQKVHSCSVSSASSPLSHLKSQKEQDLVSEDASMSTELSEDASMSTELSQLGGKVTLETQDIEKQNSNSFLADTNSHEQNTKLNVSQESNTFLSVSQESNAIVSESQESNSIVSVSHEQNAKVSVSSEDHYTNQESEIRVPRKRGRPRLHPDLRLHTAAKGSHK